MARKTKTIGTKAYMGNETITRSAVEGIPANYFVRASYKAGHTGHRTGGVSRLVTQDIGQEVYQGWSHMTQDRRCINAGHTGHRKKGVSRLVTQAQDRRCFKAGHIGIHA